MGYSKSKKAVFKVKYYLDKMLESKVNISFQHRNPAKLAYSLHNAFHAARFFPDTKRYADLRGKFEITYHNQVVECTRKEQFEFTEPDPIDVVSISDIFDPLSVISSAIKYKASIMNFPDYDPSIMTTTIIENWCQSNGYKLEPGEDNGITLIRGELTDGISTEERSA